MLLQDVPVRNVNIAWSFLYLYVQVLFAKLKYFDHSS